MIVVSRKPDETLLIGTKLSATVTDVDAGGARIIVRGELIGGAQDGASVDQPFELGIDGEISLGSMVRLTLVRIATNEQRAYLGVIVPKHIGVHRKEVFEASGRQKRKEQ